MGEIKAIYSLFYAHVLRTCTRLHAFLPIRAPPRGGGFGMRLSLFSSALLAMAVSPMAAERQLTRDTTNCAPRSSRPTARWLPSTGPSN